MIRNSGAVPQLLSAQKPSNVRRTVGTTSSRPLAKASPRYLSSLRTALGTNNQRAIRRSRVFTGDFLPRVDATLRATPACECTHKLVGGPANRQTERAPGPQFFQPPPRDSRRGANSTTSAP